MTKLVLERGIMLRLDAFIRGVTARVDIISPSGRLRVPAGRCAKLAGTAWEKNVAPHRRYSGDSISGPVRIACTAWVDRVVNFYIISCTSLVAKNEQLWDVSLYAQGRFGNQYDEGIGSERIADVTAGLRFTIPINDLRQRQQLVDANASYQSAELQLQIIRSGIEMQVRGSASRVDLLWQQLAIAEKSRDKDNPAFSVSNSNGDQVGGGIQKVSP